MEVRTEALYSIPTEPIKGIFYRYIRTKFANEPLSTHGAMSNGGRYNVAGLFAALYLGFDHLTCQAEVSQGIAAGVPFKRGAFTVWDYETDLRAIIRLDNNAILQEIGVTESDITISGNYWTASAIGEHLHNRGNVEGLVAPSAQLMDYSISPNYLCGGYV